MDFPLHLDNLILVDKRCVSFPCTLTMTLIIDSDCAVRVFKIVVEHIHGLVLTRGVRHRDTKPQCWKYFSHLSRRRHSRSSILCG